MSETAPPPTPVLPAPSQWRELIGREDWWAIWIGCGLVLAGALLLSGGHSLKWLAIAPTKWSHLPEALAQLRLHALQYLALFVLWSVLFGIGLATLGFRVSRFLPALALVFLTSLVLFLTLFWQSLFSVLLLLSRWVCAQV